MTRPENGADAIDDPGEVSERAGKARSRDRVRRFQVMTLGVVLAMSVAYLVLALRLPLGALERPRAGFFPTGVGVLLVVSSVSAIVTTLRGRSFVDQDVEETDEEEGGDLGSYGAGGAFWRVPAITGVMVAYIGIANRVGHLVASIVVTVVTIRLLARRPWWQIGLLGVGLAVLTQLVFENLLGMRLPRGSWSIS